MRRTDRNGLKALARFRPAALDPARLAGSSRQRDDLVTVLSGEASKHSRIGREPDRPSQRILVPLVGAAAVALVAVGATMVIGEHPASPANPVVTGTPGGHPLLTMANSVQAQDGHGDYWESKTTSGALSLVDNNGEPYVLSSTEGEDWSIGVRPGEQSLLTMGIRAMTRPRTVQDQTRWQAAGAPHDVAINVDNLLRGKARLTTQIGGGRQTVMRTDYGADTVAIGPSSVNYDYLRRLPADQRALVGLLDTLFHKETSGNVGRSSWMFQQLGNLITFPVSSAVRASAYRILAALPGVTSLGSVTDPLGRTGVGVTLSAIQHGSLGIQQPELIFDPVTSTILCKQDVLRTPSPVATNAGLGVGTVVDYTATTQLGWTDQPPPKSAAHPVSATGPTTTPAATTPR